MSTEKSNQNVILYGVIPSTSYPLLIIFEMMLCFSLTTLTLEDEYTQLLPIFIIWVVICPGKNSNYFIQEQKPQNCQVPRLVYFKPTF